MKNDPVLLFLKMICTTLLESPERLTIDVEEDSDKVVYIAFTAIGEQGLLIGQGGKTAQAIRRLLRAYAQKLEFKCVFFEISPTPKSR